MITLLYILGGLFLLSFVYVSSYIDGFYRKNRLLNKSIYENAEKRDLKPAEFVNDVAFINDEYLQKCANVTWGKEDEN